MSLLDNQVTELVLFWDLFPFQYGAVRSRRVDVGGRGLREGHPYIGYKQIGIGYSDTLWRHIKVPEHRNLYAPTHAEFEWFHRRYPTLDVENPNWLIIQADLVAARYSQDEIEGMSIHTVLKVLKAIENPLSDEDIYVGASTLISDAFPRYRNVKNVLDNNADRIRTRKPSKNRLQVHKADWATFLMDREPDSWKATDIPTSTIDDVAKATEGIRREKQKRGEKVSNPTSRLLRDVDGKSRKNR